MELDELHEVVSPSQSFSKDQSLEGSPERVGVPDTQEPRESAARQRRATALRMGSLAMASHHAAGDLEEQVWGVLKTCYDPEIPVNIVDLGLVYDMRIAALDGGGSRIDVRMTLTAPGCGMGTSIAADARHKLLALAGVAEAEVELVWEPPWTPQMISPEGRERLGMA